VSNALIRQVVYLAFDYFSSPMKQWIRLSGSHMWIKCNTFFRTALESSGALLCPWQECLHSCFLAHHSFADGW